MTDKKLFFCAVIGTLMLSFPGGTVHAGARPDDVVERALENVWDIRQETSDLDEFGRVTMAQAMEVLTLKDRAIEPLIFHLSWEQDWMVRYWLADLLGYFRSDRVADILQGVVGDTAEEMPVRMKAVDSLGRQFLKEARVRLGELARSVTHKKLKRKIRDRLQVISQKKKR